MVPPNGVCAAAVGIDVDELPVLGRVGERVDPRLVDRQPARDADLLADAARISSRLAIGISRVRHAAGVRHDQRAVGRGGEGGLGRIGELDALLGEDREARPRAIAVRSRGDLVRGRVVRRSYSSSKSMLDGAEAADRAAHEACSPCATSTASLAIDGTFSSSSGGGLVDEAERQRRCAGFGRRRDCGSPARAAWCWP